MSLIMKELLKIGATALERAGCMDPRIDAELLMRHMLSLDKQQLFIKSPNLLDEKTCEAFFKLIDIRAGGMPVQYITGEQEFMGITFKVDENVLIPRQDTETLVEEVISEIKKEIGSGKVPRGGYSVLDLCCGSGAIGVSLCKLMNDVKVTAADISVKALAVAIQNAKDARVFKRMKFIESDLLAALKKGFRGSKYHLIVSNPPYIESSVIPTLQREVAEHEPLIALDGGEDGLDFYRRIVAEAPIYLKKGGMLIMEIGYNQGAALMDLIDETGKYEKAEIVKDLAGLERIVKCRAKKVLA